MEEDRLDLVLVPLGLLVFGIYHVWLLFTLNQSPRRTVIGLNAESRRQWVFSMMAVSSSSLNLYCCLSCLEHLFLLLIACDESRTCPSQKIQNWFCIYMHAVCHSRSKFGIFQCLDAVRLNWASIERKVYNLIENWCMGFVGERAFETALVVGLLTLLLIRVRKDDFFFKVIK